MLHVRMASISNLKIIRILPRISQNILNRNIMATSSRAEKAIEKLEQNAYYAKYADKIAKLQQTSPEEFLSRIEVLDKKEPKKKQENVTDGKFSQLLNPKKPLERRQSIEEAPLDKVMKVDLIQDKTPEEIKEIWHKYHVEKNFISAVIPASDFEELNKNALEFPTFLFPLPRSQGYEFIMCQFAKNSVHFTPLLYYQVHKENAPECLTITHYTEFKDDKEIVLMRGEFDKNVIDIKEAQCLANQLQLYYVKPSEEKLKLLRIFTNKPDEFKHMDLIKQIENLSM